MQQSPSAEPTHVPTGTQPQVAVPASPAMAPPRWSGKKTAIVAALAIGVATVGTAGVASAVPQGTGSDAGMSQGRMGGPGGGPGGRRHMPPPGQMGQMGQTGQGQTGQNPGSPGQNPGSIPQAPGSTSQDS